MLSNSLFTPLSQNSAALGNLDVQKSGAHAPQPRVSSPSNKQLAESIFSELRGQGLKDRDIVSISSELLSRLTYEIQTRHQSVSTESL